MATDDYILRTPSFGFAQSLLGRNFITPEEVARATKKFTAYSDAQLEVFRDTLPHKEDLEWCLAYGAFLFPGTSTKMSLLDIQDFFPEQFYFNEGNGHVRQISSLDDEDDVVEPCWIALQKEPAVDSINRIWDEQHKLLIPPSCVPNAAVVAWGAILSKIVRETSLFPSLFVRTSSTTDKNHICLSNFGGEGLFLVNSYPDTSRNIHLGVAVARIFPHSPQ